jgi:hypothetical protein
MIARLVLEVTDPVIEPFGIARFRPTDMGATKLRAIPSARD